MAHPAYAAPANARARSRRDRGNGVSAPVSSPEYAMAPKRVRTLMAWTAISRVQFDPLPALAGPGQVSA